MYEVKQKIISELESRGVEVFHVDIDDAIGRVIISVGYCCCDMGDAIDVVRYVVSSHYNYNTLLLDI